MYIILLFYLFQSVANDVDIQNLVFQYLEAIPLKYGDIYTEFVGQNEYFINNIDHIVISESPSNSVVNIFTIFFLFNFLNSENN